MTLDIIRALNIDDCAWFPATPDAPAPDERLIKGLEMLADIRGQEGWAGFQNGLSHDENLQLAATHRPSEIAALISLGLGKRFAADAGE